MRSLLLLVCLALLWTAPAGAVLIDSGDGSGNTTPPPDDPGFEYVGRRGSLVTAVYLGDGWVLTADHVGIGPVTLDGITYNPIPGAEIQMDNGDGTFADLKLFGLQTYPNWPMLPISDTTPSIGDDIIMIGGGRDRGAPTSWDPNGPPPPGPIGGYLWDTPRTIRWGTNQIEDIPATPIQDTWAIGSLFDAIGQGGTPHEAMAADGDSGGAFFIKRGGTWELAGIMYVIFIYTGQPVDTSLYGDITYASDLAMYRDQIKDITGLPEPTGAGPVGALLVLALGRRRRARR